MQGKRFHSWTRQNRAKLGWDQKVDFKKSFKLYRQIFSTDLTKVGINFIHFARMKVSKMKQRVNIMLRKAIFPTNHSNWGNIKKNFRQFIWRRWYITDFSYIYRSYGAFYSVKHNFKVLNDIKQQFLSLNLTFML